MDQANNQFLGSKLPNSALNNITTCNHSSEPEYSPHVLIQRGAATQVPVFCIPGAGASITSFNQLVDALGDSLPVHGLQPIGLCGNLPPYIDVASAARSNLNAIRKICAGKPFHLLGHSFGGKVAFEMAQQLLSNNEEPVSLIIIDSDAPESVGDSKPSYSHIEILLRLVDIYNMTLPSPMGLGESDFIGLDTEQQLDLLLSKLISFRILPSRVNRKVLSGIVNVFSANLNTLYIPTGEYPHSLYIVAADDVEDEDKKQSSKLMLENWRKHAPRAKLRNNSGNHMTLLAKPHVEELAGWMRHMFYNSPEDSQIP